MSRRHQVELGAVDDLGPVPVVGIVRCEGCPAGDGAEFAETEAVEDDRLAARSRRAQLRTSLKKSYRLLRPPFASRALRARAGEGVNKIGMVLGELFFELVEAPDARNSLHFARGEKGRGEGEEAE